MKWLIPLTMFASAALVMCAGGRADIGLDAGACPQGSITFSMQAADPSRLCVGPPGSCSNQWLTILDSSWAELVIDPPCAADCAACQPVGCPALCAVPTRMPSGGERRTWDGTNHAPDTCGSSMPCYRPTCAPAGHYRADDG
jgi:hypothetical protein